MTSINLVDEFNRLRRDDFYPTTGLIRRCFDHFWWLSVVPLGIIILFSVVFSVPDPLSDWVFIVFGVLMGIEWALFRRMLDCIPHDLKVLAQSGRLKRRNTLPYTAFDEELRNRIRWSFCVGRGKLQLKIEGWQLATALAIGLMLVYIVLFNSLYNWIGEIQACLSGIGTVEYRYLIRHLFSGLVGGPIPLFWAFPIGAGLWVVIAVGLTLMKFTAMFELDPIPGHPDGSGGLRILGGICFRLGILSVVPQLVTLMMFLYGQTVQTDSIVVTLAGFVSVMFAVLAFPCFVLPVWRIHQEMKLRRDEYEANLAARAVEAEQQLRTYFGAAPAYASGLEPIQQKIDTLRKLHPSERKFPTWPFSRRIALVISPNIIIPLITTFVSLPPDVKEFIKGVLSLGQSN
jgi:hypothetical protein